MRFIFTPIFLAIFLSCTQKTDTHEDKSDIPEKQQTQIINLSEAFNKKESINLSDIADSLIYIPLETKKNNLLDGIDQLFVTENYFIISDSYRCYLFNRKGKFIRHIGKVGKGPGECMLIRSIDIDPEKGYVYINPNWKRHLLKYNFQGDYLGSLGNELDISEILFFDTIQFIYNVENYNGDAKFKYIVKDINDSILFRFKNYLQFNYSAGNMGSVLSRNSSNFFVRNSYGIYAKPFFNDTIFQILSPDKITPRFVFDCEDMRLPMDLLGNNPKYFAESPNYLVPSDITINNNYVFVELEYQKKKYGGFYSKKTQKSYVTTSYDDGTYGFYNNFDGGLPFWPITTRNEDELIGYMDAYQLKEHFSGRELNLGSENHKNLIELSKKITTNNNPILIIAKIKKNSTL